MPSAVVFDMDGVVYLGNTPVLGAAQAISSIRAMGAKALFLTNNATAGRASFARKLCGMGIKCAPSDIMNSAHGVGRYLAQYALSAENHGESDRRSMHQSGEPMFPGRRKTAMGAISAKTAKHSLSDFGIIPNSIFRDSFFRRLANSKPKDISDVFGAQSSRADMLTGVFVIGEEGLKSEVSHSGCRILSEREAARAKFVVVGLDRHATYRKFAAAHLALQNGAKFIAANKDPTLPLEDRAAPGSGSLVALLETAAGRHADVVIGKPGTLLLDLLLAEHNLSPRDVIYVGDRPEIDMAMANSAGVKSVLVLTGVTKKKDVPKLRGSLKPTYVLDSIANLPGLLRKTGI